MNLKSLLKEIKLREAAIKSTLLAVALVVIGVYTIKTVVKERGQTVPAVQIGDEDRLPESHMVTSGEDLWNISEKYYGSGYNWVDIAQANDLVNPNVITAGQELKLPKVPARILGSSPSPEPTTEPEVELVMENESNNQKHKVQKGDNLWKIAEKYYESGYNWVDIANANNLKNPGVLTENQELTLPEVAKRTKTVLEVTTASQEAIKGDTYEVAKGDSLWTISVRAYGDGYKWPEVAKKNELKSPGLILPGQKLTLPR